MIVLSARDQEQQKVAALDAGADDYVTKPFGVGELLARMRTALRHANRGTAESSVIAIGNLRVDLAARIVARAGQEVHLTPLEYKLLVTLLKHAGKVLTHRFLLREVWGPQDSQETHYLRVFVASLRAAGRRFSPATLLADRTGRRIPFRRRVTPFGDAVPIALGRVDEAALHHALVLQGHAAFIRTANLGSGVEQEASWSSWCCQVRVRLQ